MPRKKAGAAPAARKLKWIGLGESEYVSRCGTFLVQLRDKLWHLHRRVEIDAEDLPSWTWSESLFEHKRKGACQDEADKNPKAEAPDDVPRAEHEPRAQARSDSRERKAISNFQRGTEDHNASCWCCGVPFTKKAKWRFGDLCGSGCMDIVAEVLEECEAFK